MVRAKYDMRVLRSNAELQDKVGRSVAVPPQELLALLDDLERYRKVLERIVAWDYACRDDGGCEAGELAAQAFNEKGMV